MRDDEPAWLEGHIPPRRIPDRSDGLPGCAVLLILAGLAGLVSLLSGVAAGQAPDDALLLARVCIHEAGWEDTGDCEAIHAVILGVSERRGISYRRAAFAYAGGALDRHGAKAWAAELTPACREPASWPDPPHNGWPAYVDRCRAAFARAREVYEGTRSHACPADPHDWGGPIDRPRARRLGLIRIDCSAGDVETLNDFYLRPSLVREGGE